MIGNKNSKFLLHRIVSHIHSIIQAALSLLLGSVLGVYGRVQHDGVHVAGEALHVQLLEGLGRGLELQELLHLDVALAELPRTLAEYLKEGAWIGVHSIIASFTQQKATHQQRSRLTCVRVARINPLERQRLGLEEQDQEVGHLALAVLHNNATKQQ